MQMFIITLLHFGIANARASAFGAYLLSILLLTKFVSIPFLHPYDFIFIAAVSYQTVALLLGKEPWQEFAVIGTFHLLATIMELFKTSASIGSWTYPGISGALFAVGTVPLFSGFLYSAVGSYISRAMRYLHLEYRAMPKHYHLWIASVAIYLNFFTHHFVFDIRYVILAYVFFIFYKTKVHFRTHRARQHMPLLFSAFLVAIFVWVGENVGTFANVWLYPHQYTGWELVSAQKIGSWFLLLILSFSLVTIVHKDRIKTG